MEARAFLSSREARQMSVSDIERELHRRRQELVRKLLKEHRDQRSPREAAGPVEGASRLALSRVLALSRAPAVSSARSGASTNATRKRPPAQWGFRGRVARRAVTTVCIRSLPR